MCETSRRLPAERRATELAGISEAGDGAADGCHSLALGNAGVFGELNSAGIAADSPLALCWFFAAWGRRAMVAVAKKARS